MKQDQEFTKELIDVAFKYQLFVEFIDDIVEFKKPIPSGYPWSGEVYNETLIPKENEIFLVFEGNRHSLDDIVGKIYDALVESYHYARLVDLETLDAHLYLDEFHQKNRQKPFENDYVKIY